ncbi:MAG: hypothetical protein NZ826_05990 [Thermodesulfovibrio sp.]|nr:hypothetical protein [Thermodesulfovibrio sp.]
MALTDNLSLLREMESSAVKRERIDRMLDVTMIMRKITEKY